MLLSETPVFQGQIVEWVEGKKANHLVEHKTRDQGFSFLVNYLNFKDLQKPWKLKENFAFDYRNPKLKISSQKEFIENGKSRQNQ